MTRIAAQRNINSPGIVSLVYSTLKKDIITGKLVGGDRILQERIAGELGVSHIPVREALMKLEGEGLVVVKPRKGAFVTQLSLIELREIAEIRTLLETHALGLAIDCTDEDLFLQAVSKARDAIRQANNEKELVRIAELNWEFHSALIGPAQRPKLLSVIMNIGPVNDRYARFILSDKENVRAVQRDHRMLLEAYSQRQKKLAIDLLRAHIGSVESEFIKAWSALKR